MAATRSEDRGFTMIELLISIIVLGVLAAVVVFAVGGSTDRANETACTADGRTLSLAEDAFNALHGRYATEAELAAAGVIRTESDLNDITLIGNTYTVVTVATCTTTPATTTTTPATTTTTPATTTTTPATTTTTPQVPTRLAFSVQPTQTPAGASISPFTVTVRDASNNIVTASNATVTLTLSGTGNPSASLTCGSTSMVATGGSVTFTGCSISKKSSGYTLTAKSPNLGTAVSAAFNVT